MTSNRMKIKYPWWSRYCAENLRRPCSLLDLLYCLFYLSVGKYVLPWYRWCMIVYVRSQSDFHIISVLTSLSVHGHALCMWRQQFQLKSSLYLVDNWPLCWLLRGVSVTVKTTVYDGCILIKKAGKSTFLTFLTGAKMATPLNLCRGMTMGRRTGHYYEHSLQVLNS